MKKFLALLIVLTTLLGTLFAHGGTMSGEEDLRVTKTKWFDIIYPARSEKAATLLYENADRIYEEIGEMYGYAPKFRLPVVICPGVEQFNGYMSTGIYNHIVLFDTSMIYELAVFTDTFLNLFKHECIHAYTFNLKNETWTKIARILGDPMNFGSFVISGGMAEGATVSGESALGEGRLNNEYTKQMVKQSKIEGKFPNYYDVQGARDTYPANSFYFFNGAFCEWLQNKYGMSKYARFWYHCCNFQNATQSGAFKDVYDIKLKKAWKQFTEEYSVPDVPANPVEAGQAQDFFAPSNTKYSMKNKAGALYTFLSASETGIAYMEQNSHKVYYISFDDLQASQEKVKPKKLFTSAKMFDLKSSKDGRYLALSVYDYAKANVRTITQIYDMETKKFFTLPDHGYYEPSVIKNGNEYFVIRQGYETPYYTIRVDKLSFDETGRIAGATEVVKQILPLNIAPFSFTDLGNGTFAYIKKTGMVFTIEVMDLEFNVLTKFALPKDHMIIRHLSYADNKLMFSWTEPGTLPRLGTLSLTDGTFELQEEDISGGVYYPVSIPNSDSITYIGNFYLQNRLLTTHPPRWLSLSKPAEGELSNSAEGELSNSAEEELPESEEPESSEVIGIQPQASEIPYDTYNAFNYFKRGVIIPLSTLTTTSYSPNFSGSYTLPLGITYMTSDPWDSINLQLGAGYGLVTNSGAIDILASGTNGTGTFTYSAEAGTEFYPKGWKKVTAAANVSEQYPVGDGWISGQAAAQLNFGKSDGTFKETGNSMADLLALITPGSVVSEDKDNYTMFATGIVGGYTNVNRSGPGKYENAGLKAFGTLYYTFWNNATKRNTYYNGLDVELYSVIAIPKLIPIDCVRGISYNLPTHILLDLFPSNIQNGLLGGENYKWAVETFKANLPVATFDVETLLFGWDVQKSTFIRYLYLNDIQLTAGYAGIFVEDIPSYSDFRLFHMGSYINKIKAGDVHYEDYLNMRIAFTFTPNLGQAFTSFKNALYFEFGITGLGGLHASPKPLFTLGLSSSLF